MLKYNLLKKARALTLFTRGCIIGGREHVPHPDRSLMDICLDPDANFVP